jgi:hypothetical protein
MPIYEALAQAFAAEGVDTHFTLLGRREHALGGGHEESRRHGEVFRTARALRLRHWPWAIT